MKRSVTLDDVFQQAKKILMREGHHAPLLMVETDNQVYLLPPPLAVWNGSTLEKEKGLFLLGRTFAREQYETHDSVKAIFLITEAWFASYPEGTDLRKVGRPAEQPDRRESINVLELRIVGKTLKQAMYIAEIIRHGGVVDLGSREMVDEVRSMLLTSFLAGIISCELNDADLVASLRRYKEVGEL